MWITNTSPNRLLLLPFWRTNPNFEIATEIVRHQAGQFPDQSADKYPPKPDHSKSKVSPLTNPEEGPKQIQRKAKTDPMIATNKHARSFFEEVKTKSIVWYVFLQQQKTLNCKPWHFRLQFHKVSQKDKFSGKSSTNPVGFVKTPKTLLLYSHTTNLQ